MSAGPAGGYAVPAVVAVLDHTLGQLRLAQDGGEERVVGVDLAPGAGDALAGAAAAGSAVVLLVPRVLHDSERRGLAETVPGVSTVAALPAAGDLAGGLAGVLEDLMVPRGSILVSADRAVRAGAAALGLAAVPHLALVPAARRGDPPVFTRLVGTREALARVPELVPYGLERQAEPDRPRQSGRAAPAAPEGRSVVFGVAPASVVRAAAAHGLDTVSLAGDPAVCDWFWIRTKGAAPDAIAGAADLDVVYAEPERILVASRAEPAAVAGLHGAHGHFELLMPAPGLLANRPPPEGPDMVEAWAHRLWPHNVQLKPIDAGLLRPDLWRCSVPAGQVEADVDRYSGGVDPGGGPIRSRHVRHGGNARAVDLLLADLAAAGYTPHTFSFTYAGATYRNVIADLPGSGCRSLSPDIRELLRDRLIRRPWPDPDPDPWLRDVADVLPAGFAPGSPAGTVVALERLLRLEPWFPWWRRGVPLPGAGAGIVVVGCHLDSTAAGDPGYDPATDDAPGRDDDASGIAAVLGIARAMAPLAGSLAHTVRFCFFNAEETGLVGSKAYAEWLKATGAPLRAVVCCDMVGYNSDPVLTFEIHAGYTDPAVRDRSVPIAERIAAWAASLGELGPAQIYRGTSNAAGGVDRDLYDGAINRSDHASFHQQGYPAVVVSEDFFANLPSETPADANPHYHRASDTVVDASYGAKIACAVLHAVTALARDCDDGY